MSRASTAVTSAHGPRPLWWIVAKMLAQTVVFWGLFLGVLPLLINWLERRMGAVRFHGGDQAIELCGWAVFAIGGALGLVSASVMAFLGRGTPLPLDPASRLVVRGPYAHVRNPMAIGGLAQGVGVGLVLGSWGVLIYVAAGALLWQMFVRRREEADLLRRFGEPYACYRAAVPCWRPRPAPYRGEKFTQT